MSRGATQIHQTALGQNDNFAAVFEGVNVDLRLYEGYGHDLAQAPAWSQRQFEIYETFLAR